MIPVEAGIGMMIDTVEGNRRFSWALRRRGRGPNLPFDRDLFDFAEAAVTPTVGAITPAWLLVVPRVASFCAAELPVQLRDQVVAIVREVRHEMSVFPGRTFLFEHGARKIGSATGCGVDQAHLHLVNLEVDLIQTVLMTDPHMNWVAVNPLDPWETVPPDREYHLLGDLETAFISYSGSGKSQYFRQVIARELARPNEWDYRLFTHEQNARKTASLIDARRERSAA